MAPEDFRRSPPPGALGEPREFSLHVLEDDLARLRTIVELSPIGPTTFENSAAGDYLGITRAWLEKAKHEWVHNFNWRQHERRINSLPNFKMRVGNLDIHFVALFSAHANATPVIFMHGWPGSFLELWPVLELLANRYTPDTLPFHAIVPSLPGYAMSDAPPLESDFGLSDAAQVMDGLMTGLGFGAGYVAYGGDVGSMLAMIMSAKFESCRALHVTYLAPNPSELPTDIDGLTEREIQHVARAKEWRATGMGYAIEQGTRPATVGLAISASPLAALAWIGEKFIEWAGDEPIDLDTILCIVSLYCLTSSYPRSIWSYRSIMKEGRNGLPTSREKPLAYSLFPHELGILPKAWAQKLYPNLRIYAQHSKGGHFPGLEQPRALLEDIITFVHGLP